MSKYLVLALISLLTTLIQATVLIVRIIIILKTWNVNSAIVTELRYVTMNWMFVDLLTNLLCFMMQFSFFGTKSYYKYCGFVDQSVQSLVKGYAVESMKTKVESMQSDSIDTPVAN